MPLYILMKWDKAEIARHSALTWGGQVRAAGVEPGEEVVLRGRLRRMEARRSSVQRCGLVVAAQSSLQEGVRAVQTQLNAVLAEEQAQADALAGAVVPL